MKVSRLMQNNQKQLKSRVTNSDDCQGIELPNSSWEFWSPASALSGEASDDRESQPTAYSKLSLHNLPTGICAVPP